MLPTQQGLEAADLATGDHDRRLKLKDETAAPYGVTHVAFQGAALRGRRVLAALEKAEGVPSRGFGAIQREIGVLQQLVRVATVFGPDRDADADADRHALPVEFDGALDRADDVIGNAAHVFGAIEPGQDDREFVTRRTLPPLSASRTTVFSRSATIRSRSSPAEWPSMSLTRLEAIEIAGDDREPVSVTRGAKAFLFEAVAKQAAVRQVRERIVQRHMRDGLLRRLALRDVDVGSDHARGLAAFVPGYDLAAR